MTKKTKTQAQEFEGVRFPVGVEVVAMDDLVPYERNARTHSDAQLRQIADSMIEFGWTSPVLADADGNVLAGHGRLEAARSLGLTVAPVVRVDGLTDEQRRAYILADNQIALLAGWDTQLLKLEIEALAGVNFNMESIGFSPEQLSAIVANVFMPQRDDGENDPDAEWNEMPEFGQDDLMAYRDIVIHFRNEDDIAAFAKLVGQTITDKTKYLWFPPNEIDRVKDLRFDVANDGSAGSKGAP